MWRWQGGRSVAGKSTHCTGARATSYPPPLLPGAAALPWDTGYKIELVLFVVGGGDLQGRGCGLHRGGAGVAGLSPEKAVPGCDGGELLEPGLSG